MSTLQPSDSTSSLLKSNAGPAASAASAEAAAAALQSFGQSLDADPALSTPMKPRFDANGFMRFLPNLIKEMNQKGVPFNMGANGEITIDGFYRNGPMRMRIEDNDVIVTIDKRDKRTVMRNYDDLIQLNFEWWKMSSTTKGVYIAPDRPWLDEFVQRGLAKRQVIYVPREDGSE